EKGRGCTLPVAQRLHQSARDSCIDCHMPPYAASDIVHTASTDHRIPRVAKPVSRADARPAPRDGFPVVSFYRERKGAGDEEDERDLAVALVTLALRGQASAARVHPRALPMLEAALQRDPEDRVVGEARGFALALQSRPAEALVAFEAVLARVPEREPALVGAASNAEALRQTEAALGYWRQAVAVNPWVPDYRRSLALLLVTK